MCRCFVRLSKVCWVLVLDAKDICVAERVQVCVLRVKPNVLLEKGEIVYCVESRVPLYNRTGSLGRQGSL